MQPAGFVFGYFDNGRQNISEVGMDKDAVKEYVERSQSTIEDSPQMGEATTKAAVLRDFLELLDWQIPSNTELEYSVKAFGRTFKVDYALVLESAPVAFLEAKGVDTPLTDDHREQIQEYMKSEDVNLGILTNGEQYVFFRRQVINTKVRVNTLAEMSITELPDRVTILRAFTKGAIQNDESEKILNRIRELRDARNTLEAEKDPLATDVATLITENVSETISAQAESQAKEMIDRLIQDIEGEIDSETGTTATTPTATTPSENTKTQTATPHPEDNAIAGTISRTNISGDDSDSVVIFPSKKSGVEFLKENNAWGFVRIGQSPEFIAMYISEDVQQVKYVAKIKSIVDATEADLARPPEAYFESASEDAQAGFDPNKKVIVFEEESLYELEDPIPFGNSWPQSLRYTTLGELQTAKTTDDVL